VAKEEHLMGSEEEAAFRHYTFLVSPSSFLIGGLI